MYLSCLGVSYLPGLEAGTRREVASNVYRIPHVRQQAEDAVVIPDQPVGGAIAVTGGFVGTELSIGVESVLRLHVFAAP